jgi:hypothetical protein
MKMAFEHAALNLDSKNRIVFIAMSKHSFYFAKHAVKYVLDRGFTPISQFGNFGYFLLDTVERDVIRNANNNLLRISDEMWVFGPVSDGVLAEVLLCKKQGKPVKYFGIRDSKEAEEIEKSEVELESGVEKFRNEL